MWPNFFFFDDSTVLVFYPTDFSAQRNCFWSLTVTACAIGPEKTRKTMKLKIDEGTQRKVSCDQKFSFPLIRSLNIVLTPWNSCSSPQISRKQAKRTVSNPNVSDFSKMTFWDHSNTSECYQAILGPFWDILTDCGSLDWFWSFSRP